MIGAVIEVVCLVVVLVAAVHAVRRETGLARALGFSPACAYALAQILPAVLTDDGDSFSRLYPFGLGGMLASAALAIWIIARAKPER